ncbi:MAG: SDR family oxidoreductase [Lachnospiraceae bacterium]|nr:SDR family oxidoreductase [Lachnospiraceae bacterium]
MVENNKKTILVTGGTSGIGLATAKALALAGNTVFALGRNIGKAQKACKQDNLFFYSCNLTEDSGINKALAKIKEEKGISFFDVCVFSAGVGYYGLHENLEEDNIKELVNVNLLSPLLLTNKLLSGMKQRGSGHFIFLSSVTAERVNPHGAAYGATKAALSSFAASIFEEARKNGVKVTSIEPDMTDTDLYRNAYFTADPETALKAEDVAEAVLFAVERPEGVNTSLIRLQPQKHRLLKK